MSQLYSEEIKFIREIGGTIPDNSESSELQLSVLTVSVNLKKLQSTCLAINQDEQHNVEWNISGIKRRH